MFTFNIQAAKVTPLDAQRAIWFNFYALSKKPTLSVVSHELSHFFVDRIPRPKYA